MHVRNVSTYKDSVEQTSEQSTDESAVRAADVACPECDGELVTADREVVCATCGLVVEEQYVDLAPRFQLKNVEKEEDKHGLETASPYFLDPNGSPYQDAPLGVTFPTRRSDWRFDGTDTPVSNGTYEKWDDIRYRQVRHVVDSRDNWRTDALQDIKTMGRSAGIPRHVCERATALFREALAARLAGGRMAYESLAVGALVVAARDAGCSQSVDDVAQWARTPHERACAGARKIRLGLDLVETTPAVRPGVTADLVGTLADDGQYTGVDGDRADVTDLATTLMQTADRVHVGPGTPRATVAGAAVHRAGLILAGGGANHAGPSIPDVVAAVEPIVATSRSRIERYSVAVRDAFREA